MPLKPLPKKRVIRKLSGTELPPLIVGRERSESVAIMKKKIVKKKTGSTASYQVSTKVVPQIVTDQERYEMNLTDLEDYLV